MSHLRREIGMLIALILMGAGLYTSNHSFLNFSNSGDLLRNISMLGIFAVGMAFVIITGGIDLSVGSLVGLTGVIIAKLSSHEEKCWGWNLYLGIAIAIGVVLLIGLVQGLLITKLDLQPFIVTLGGMMIFRGISQTICESGTLSIGDSPLSNPAPWNSRQRPGDNKWSLTVFARNPDTGYAKWAYQITAHDAWDYDEIMENIVVDADWNGRPRKLLLHPSRNGFMLVLDRETGELLSAQSFQPSTNWASGYDLKTGQPQEDPAKRTHLGKKVESICPSSTGAKEFVPSSLSPRTGLLYIPAHNTCMNYKGMEVNYIAGTPYLGADVQMFPGPGGYQGELEAWDFRTGKKVWGIKDDKFPVYSGVLTTAGDVLFYGTMEGWFRAVNARTGDILWQFKTGSGIIGNPMTYIGPDGKQYVAILVGQGGAWDKWFIDGTPELKKVHPSSALYVFSLN